MPLHRAESKPWEARLPKSKGRQAWFFQRLDVSAFQDHSQFEVRDVEIAAQWGENRPSPDQAPQSRPPRMPCPRCEGIRYLARDREILMAADEELQSRTDGLQAQPMHYQEGILLDVFRLQEKMAKTEVILLFFLYC